MRSRGNIRILSRRGKTTLAASFALCLLLAPVVFAGETLRERDYQTAWCAGRNGKTEVVLPDRARIDCLTDEYAIEFDFGKKWAEAVGQALYYANMSGRKPGIVLILKSQSDLGYLTRLRKATEGAYPQITIWTIGP